MSRWFATNVRRKSCPNATYRKHAMSICRSCGKPLDTGWTSGGYNNRTHCLLCITAAIMQDFVFVTQKQRLEQSKQQ